MDYDDFYFRFPDELTAEQALVALHAAYTSPFVDRLGVIYDQQGRAISGWHVNIALPEGSAIPTQMQPFQIQAPLFPKRVRFTGEESLT